MEANDKSYALNETNPWKGLNFYKEGEVLYGRDDEIQSLALYVINNIQTVLYGKSGIGKSSIINAGVFPIARKEGLFPIPIRLKHDQDTTYIEQIRAAFAESGIGIKEILPAINEQEESLWEYLHRQTFYEKESNVAVRPLIVLDQFEEFFTLQHNESKKKAFFSELADLLNEVTPQYIIKAKNEADTGLEKQSANDNSGFVLDLGQSEPEETAEYITDSLFNIVFTIREDFLSYLERYTKFIPVMKSNRYALLPLNEEQAKDVIMKPIPGLVDIDVAKLIIQKVTGRTDFNLGNAPEIDVDAAVLSLYLSRLYLKKGKGNAITAELVDLSSRDIIKDFYEESVSDLPETDVEKIEDQLLTYDGRRNNVSWNDLISEGVSEKSIYTLVEDKKLLRQFSYQDDIRIEFMHDILCPVVDERIEKREQLAKEREQKKKEEEEKARREKERQVQEEKLKKAEEEKQLLIRKQELQEEENKLLQRKQEEERLRQEREKREIEEKAIAEKEAMERKALSIKKRNRRYMLAAAGIVLFVVGYFFFDKFWNDRVFSENYARFETINGWPKGIGKLTDKECEHTPLYYKLSYKGYKNRRCYTDVEVMSSNERLPNYCRIPMLEWADDEESDSKAKQLNDILRQVVRIHFLSNEESDDISREEWFGKNDKMLMAINYFHQPNGGAWAQFYTPNGENMEIRSNHIDRLKLSWDSAGHIESAMYYDEKQVPRDIIEQNNIKGYFWERIGTDSIIQYMLNEFGLPITQSAYNTTMTINKNNTTDIRYFKSARIGDAQMKEVACENGVSRMVIDGDSILLFELNKTVPTATRTIERDPQGNTKKIETKGKTTFGFPNFINYEYEKGLISKEEWLADNNGTPFCKDSTLIYKWEYRYDENASIIEEKFTNINDIVAYHYKTSRNILRDDTITTYEMLDINKTPHYFVQIDTVSNSHSSTTFYGKDKVLINNYILAGSDSLLVHRVVTSKTENLITKEYYVYDSHTVIPMPTSYVDSTYAKTYFRRIEEYDNAGNMTSLRIEDQEGTIIKSMMYFIQNGQPIGRAVKGIDGNPVRCDKWEEEGFLYYKFYYCRNRDKNLSAITAVDEWDHRSAIWNGEAYLCAIPYRFKGKDIIVQDNDPWETTIYNTYEQLVFIRDTLMSSFKIPYIHVLSNKSKMYNNGEGIIDGDRVVEFGNWRYGQTQTEFEKEWFSVLRNKASVHIVVLRPIPSSYLKKEFNITISKNEEFLIEPHILHLTVNEYDFIKEFLK